MLNKRGFTLIELLVTISIIAILSTIAMTVYSQVTMNARDARRKLDLQNIAQALEIYYQKNGRYPIQGWINSGASDYSGNVNTSWVNGFGLVPAYISLLPDDPSKDYPQFFTSNNETYGYMFCSDKNDCYSTCSVDNGQWYMLVAKLENHNDPDRKEVKSYKLCDGSVLSVWSKYLYIITPNQ